MITIKKGFIRTLLFFVGFAVFNLALASIDFFLERGFIDPWYIWPLNIALILLLMLLCIMSLVRAFDPAVSARLILKKGEVVEVVGHEEEARSSGVALSVRRFPYDDSRPVKVRFRKTQSARPGARYQFDGRKLMPAA